MSESEHERLQMGPNHMFLGKDRKNKQEKTSDLLLLSSCPGFHSFYLLLPSLWVTGINYNYKISSVHNI